MRPRKISSAFWMSGSFLKSDGLREIGAAGGLAGSAAAGAAARDPFPLAVDPGGAGAGAAAFGAAGVAGMEGVRTGLFQFCGALALTNLTNCPG